jgi:hypothetical protein
MRKHIWLRFIVASSVTLAALFQAAVALELHSPLPSNLVLWSLSMLSIACAVAALLAHRTLKVYARISYRPEGAKLEPRLEAAESYGVVGTYCVTLCRPYSFPVHYPHMKSFYLTETSADQARITASLENPRWRVVGVEPRNLAACKAQSERSNGPTEAWHVA